MERWHAIFLRIGHKLVNRAGDMVQEVHLTVIVFAEPNDSVSGVGEFAVIDDLPLLEAKAPEVAGVVVAVDVMTVKFFQTHPVIRQPVGDRG